MQKVSVTVGDSDKVTEFTRSRTGPHDAGGWDGGDGSRGDCHLDSVVVTRGSSEAEEKCETSLGR